jgi:hypothetical protein
MAKAIASKTTSQRFAPCVSAPGALPDADRAPCHIGREVLRKHLEVPLMRLHAGFLLAASTAILRSMPRTLAVKNASAPA